MPAIMAMAIEAADERWPLRPPPLRGELFSSWLVRLARCYEMPVRAFCQMVWPGREIWRGDIDREIDDEALQFLSAKTGVTHAELFSMTLRAHEQHAGVAPGDESASALYFHHGMSDHGIRYCPGCVAERQPYYRLEWRLAFVTVCPRHRLPLCDRCQYCKAPCLFANVNVDRDLGRCYRCDKHLASAAREVSIEAALQIELHVEFQQNMLDLLRNPRAAHT
jgi:hypothetical protein